ncbi:MAG: polyprenyl synthetase family protein [Prevotella sp.]|nr:polyprenyl synthetase family protein [Bacteroides sp.]MCM1365757.1 polyprenyl synthetase family protein [Prevotella sp.]MCM1436427.1 polyprenyl synthetase family protein [Prevotella sp.]
MKNLDAILLRHNPELTEMNQIITEALHTQNEMMDRVVSTYLLTKGKQIRPIMVILAAKFFNGCNAHTLHAGAALEMLHNASLIHDDVVDDSSLRRGKPTINFTWGNHVAVLVGDFFVSNALAAAIRTDNISIIQAVSDLGKELSLGEIDQICNVRENRLDEESYMGMIRQKTASLFRNCVRTGAQTAGASDHESEPLVQFAELLGLCFQIKDDIFDYFDDPRIGKPTGNDLREGKVTLPLLFALRNAPEKESTPARQMLAEGNLNDEQIQQLIRFAISHGGVDYAFETMRKMQHKACGLLEAYPDSEWKTSFIEIFDYIISRSN